MRSYKTWTMPEIAALQQHFPVSSIEDVLAALPGRTYIQIHTRAQHLGLKRPAHIGFSADAVFTPYSAYLYGTMISSRGKYLNKPPDLTRVYTPELLLPFFIGFSDRQHICTHRKGIYFIATVRWKETFQTLQTKLKEFYGISSSMAWNGMGRITLTVTDKESVLQLKQYSQTLNTRCWDNVNV